MSETLQNELHWYGHKLSPDFDSITVVPISDLHYGSPLCSEKHFQRTIDFIARNDNARAILNGDLLEAVTKNSLGDVYTQKLTPQQQRDNVISMLTPIKDKILGSVSGNHEARIYRETGVDIAKDIADALGCPYRAEGMLLKISFGKGNSGHENKPYTFWIYTTHGYGGARTKSAKAVKVERTATWIHSHVYFMSHDHVVNIAPDVYLLQDDRGRETDKGWLVGKIVAHRKMLVKTNAYLKWGGYSEQGGFPPVDLSTPIVKLLTPQSTFWENVPDRPEQSVRVIG